MYRLLNRGSVQGRKLLTASQFRAFAAAAPQRVVKADALVPAVVGLGAGAVALLLALRGDKGLEKRVGELEIAAAEKTSSAFVFIKPHAVTDSVKSLVSKELGKAGVTILSEGKIAAETIDKDMLIDTHYGAIASKAMKQKPGALTVQAKAQADFQKAFGLSWTDALQKGQVYNATDAAAKLGISFDQLGEKWGKLKRGADLLKFGGGFYCGKVGDIFVINGFYMDMRKAFTTPGTQIYYYEVEWPSQVMPWADFRAKLLGGTDPKTAEAGSLRNTIFKDWKSLGLKSEPNTGDNGVHASASPFEAFAERANWLGAKIETDAFGRAMLSKGVPMTMIKAWTDDPPVMFEGKKQSLFDLLEDLDARDCIAKSALIAKAN
jgi:nucleoside diphosphate kinase